MLRFTGEDQFEFLQNQGTADFRGPVSICRYSLWLDFKGRLLADSFLLKENEESSLLVSYGSPAEDLKNKFERHIIADDVEIEDLSDQFSLVHLPDTANARVVLDSLGMKLPEEGYFSSSPGGQICFRGRRLGLGSFDLLTPGSALPVDPSNAISLEAAESFRLRSGTPLIPQDCEIASTNPLELNIMSALSFEKGCYLGQEVVARVHRLGRTSRQLVRIELPPDAGILSSGRLLTDDGHELALRSVAQVDGVNIGLALLKAKNLDNPLIVGGNQLSIHPVGES